MPFIPCANVARVVIEGAQQSQIVQNVFHVYGVDGWDEFSLGGLVDDFEGWISAWLRPTYSNSMFWYKATASDLTSQIGARAEHFFSPVLSGTHGPSQEPMNSTIAVGWRTGIPGRSFRGRTYHVGITQGDSASSIMSPTSAIALVAAYGQLLTILGGGYGVLVVASFYTGGAARLAGLATPIVEVVLNRTLDSMRRRLPERGR